METTKAYHVSLFRPRERLSPEDFRPPLVHPGWPKPEGGLWLSLWREGWGPEWGLWWLVRYHVPAPRYLQAPVWEVSLEGLDLRVAELQVPDFLGGNWDGLVVLPDLLEQRVDTKPGAPPPWKRWWYGWDVRTVWLRKWPGEKRIRFLGTLAEVCPKEAVRTFLEEGDDR